MELGYNTVGLIRKFESIGIYPLYHRCASVKYLIIENISSLEVYDGSARIVSKLGEGTFHHNNRGILAGGIDYIRQNAQMQEARDRYIKGSLTPPGPPTQHGIYASPEWTGQPYPSLGWQNIRQDQEPPEGWPIPPKFNEPGDVPGPPVQYGDPITPQTVKAGYGFIDNGIIEKNLYFYHPDHLGSSSYITDREGRITQHTEYIAFGEVLFEEHSTSRTMPYLFNGKELDTETNLTYFGARYLDMKTSLWLNVDPMAEKAPNWTPYRYSFNNPIRYTDPDGHWEWDAMGNLIAQKGDNSYTLAKFLGTSQMNAMIILKRGRIIANAKGILNLKEGQMFSKNSLWVGTKSATGPVVNNTEEATNHYFNGKGASADVGDQSTIQLLSSEKFQEKHAKITSVKVQPTGYFSVDLTNETFHIGRTNVDYSVSDNGESSSVTYTLFARDGFWDPNFIAERTLGRVFDRYKPDGKGPNLEVRGGTPYDYKTRKRTFFFKPVK